MVDRLDVRGAVKGLKEPKDGYEDLEAIPFSFAVEFKDRGPWSMFADSEEEKVWSVCCLVYGRYLTCYSLSYWDYCSLELDWMSSSRYP